MPQQSGDDLGRRLERVRRQQAETIRKLLLQQEITKHVGVANQKYKQEHLVQLGLNPRFARLPDLIKRHEVEVVGDKLLATLRALELEAADLNAKQSAVHAAAVRAAPSLVLGPVRGIAVAPSEPAGQHHSSQVGARSHGYPGWLVGGLLALAILVAVAKQAKPGSGPDPVALVALGVAILALTPGFADLYLKLKDRRQGRTAQRRVVEQAAGSDALSARSEAVWPSTDHAAQSAEAGRGLPVTYGSEEPE